MVQVLCHSSILSTGTFLVNSSFQGLSLGLPKAVIKQSRIEKREEVKLKSNESEKSAMAALHCGFVFSVNWLF